MDTTPQSPILAPPEPGEKPISMDPEYEERLRTFKSDCENHGNAVACHQLAEFASVVHSDFKKSFELYRSSCYAEKELKGSPSQAQGMATTKDGGRFYPPSCFNLARQYLAGRGCAQSDAEAYKALDRACSTSHTGACHFLGVLLLDKGDKGKGGKASAVPYDGVRGVEALKTACVQGGDVNSCSLAGGALLDTHKMYEDVEKKVSYKSLWQRKRGPIHHAP